MLYHETQLWTLSLRALWIQTWEYNILKQDFIFTTAIKHTKNELFKVLPEDETGKLLLENIINLKNTESLPVATWSIFTQHFQHFH